MTEIEIDSLDRLRQQIKQKEDEISELNANITKVMLKRRETCTHPDLQVTPYDKYCPWCGYHKDRSF